MEGYILRKEVDPKVKWLKRTLFLRGHLCCDILKFLWSDLLYKMSERLYASSHKLNLP